MPSDASQFIARQLWQLLPEVYRNRDRDRGDLGKFVACCGDLLQQIHATLGQRLADAFPDTCQTWLIPYFAQLLDVRLVSPLLDGQRKEVANGVAWRQRKGTAHGLEQIAKDVGQMEVELQEGWRRVAVTRRLNMPLLPVDALGQQKPPEMGNPLEAVKHPGLESAFVDFRRASRARKASVETAVTHETSFGGQSILWRQVHPGGVPCFPDHYEDVSKRTVDLRAPDWRRGHYHPKRVLLYTPPPAGFFPPDQESLAWLDRLAHTDQFVEMEERAVDATYVENGESIQRIERVYRRPAAFDRFEEVWRRDRFENGTVRMTRTFRGLRPGSPLKVTGTVQFMDAPPAGEEMVYRFEDIYLSDTITVKYGRLEFQRVAAFYAWVQNADKIRPVFTATDSLMQRIRVARGLCQLAYCTVLGDMTIEKLQASDCILMARFEKDLATTPLSEVVCVRYCAVAEGLSAIPGAYRCTEKQPLFFSQILDTPGCGVLKPGAPRQICFGAEDGSEMGAFHHRHHCIGAIAVSDKLEDFLPVGITPVIIPDPRLWVAPP